MDRVVPALAMLLPLALLCPAAAAAEPPRASLDVDAGQRAAAAEALFDEGRRLMTLGRYAEACARFAESERMDHGVGTLLNLADCYEKNGQVASAWAGFRAASASASAEQQPDRERIAREREVALVPMLAHLTIVLPRRGLPDGAEIHRDGILLGRSLWGAPVPVDAGDHAIVVSAPGKVDYSATVHVPRQPPLTIVARIPELQDRPAPPPVTPPVGPPKSPPLHPRAIAGIALIGASGAGVAVGAIFGVRALGLKEDALPHCRPVDRCDQTGVSLRASAHGAGVASSVAFIAAGALLAGGVVLYVTAPDRPKITAVMGLSSGGAALSMGTTW